MTSSLLLPAALLVAVFRNETIENPLMHLLNLPLQLWPLLDHDVLFLALTNLPAGVVYLSSVWYAWFQSLDPDYRARILLGTTGAALAGFLGRLR